MLAILAGTSYFVKDRLCRHLRRCRQAARQGRSGNYLTACKETGVTIPSPCRWCCAGWGSHAAGQTKYRARQRVRKVPLVC